MRFIHPRSRTVRNWPYCGTMRRCPCRFVSWRVETSGKCRRPSAETSWGVVSLHLSVVSCPLSVVGRPVSGFILHPSSFILSMGVRGGDNRGGRFDCAAFLEGCCHVTITFRH